MSDIEPTPTQIEEARDAMVALVTAQLIQEQQPLNHATVARRLPQDFAYDTVKDSFERFVPKAEPEPVPVADISAPVDTRDSLHVAAHEIEQQLFDARGQLAAATTARQLARATVARCLSSFENGGRAPVTDAQLRRDYLAASVLEREQAKTNGSLRIPSGGASKFPIDNQRAAWGATPEGFVAKNMQVGNRRSFADANGNRTAAYPASQRGRKLPSER
jgi:hypothetical protein